jgi:hypothetical protein
MKRAVLFGGLLALAASFGAPAQACDECQLRKDGTYLGQFTILGNGTVRTWVKFAQGKPTSLGLTFSETALTGLKAENELPKGMPMMEYKLALPKEAKVTGFDHISLDWNPVGHPPKDIYTLPHFDMHFYLMSPEARGKISAVGADLARCEKKPDPRYIPAGYIIPPETSVPQMGAHAIDTAAVELAGQKFTNTFIYGYYNGQMNFIEPMITLDFLKSKPNFSTAIKVPQVYEKSGFYPTRYSISYDAARQEYSVALDALKWHTGKPSASKVVAPKTPAKTPAKATTKAKVKVASAQ